MSVSEQITRLQGLKNRLKTKVTALKLSETVTTLEDCIKAIEGVSDNGAIKQKLDTETTSCSVAKGYHNGEGTVSIDTEEKTIEQNGVFTPSAGKVISKVTVSVSNGDTYQEKSITPTKESQDITPDMGYTALSKVTVEPIPDDYADVTSVTAVAADVLANKIFVDSTGNEKAGEMTNNGNVIATIDGLTTTSYTIPEGYHNGSGTISLTDDIENALAAI